MYSILCLLLSMPSCTLFKGPWSNPSVGNSTAVIDKIIVQVPEIKVVVGWADGSWNFAGGWSEIGAVLILAGVVAYFWYRKRYNSK